jgi:hypothetical protein
MCLVGRFTVPALLAASLLVVGTVRAEPGPARPDTTLAYDDVPLRQVLRDVEAQTGVHFLYRDALVAGVRLSLRVRSDEVLAALATALRAEGLALRVDSERNQAILTRAGTESESSHPVLTGQVVDAASGARLALATLTWTVDGRRRGVVTSDDGTFRLSPGASLLPDRRAVTLTASHVGYEERAVQVDLRAPPSDLTIRLPPAEAAAPEVVVQSHALRSNLDTTWHPLVRPERSAALGEAGVLRALQPLPAVGLSPSLVEGLNVRGSRSDGFRVLLDGMPIFNQHHLFGLFDAFNAEALRTVGLFYGVAPVEYRAPPGGTLAFRTRSGARTGLRVAAEASPAAVSGTAEGPLADGQGSWLVSARHSVLGLDWFGNDALVAQGLGADRATAALEAGRELEEVLFDFAPPTARFFDVHAKGLWETDAGGRWTLSLYGGGDRGEQRGQRLRRDRSPSLRDRLRRDFVDTTAVETTHRWGNLGASLRWRRPVGARSFSALTAAVSRYYGRFSTDAFSYVDLDADPGSAIRQAPFSHDNTLVAGDLTHRVTLTPATPGQWTLGYAASLYDVHYAEVSNVAGDFQGGQRSVQTDLFAQYDRSGPTVDLRAGLRAHYYSGGDVVRLSPRLQVHLWPGADVSLAGGYTRNHQFLHRLHLVGDVSSAVWVPSTARQPPGRADHVMARLSLRPLPRTAARIEGYWKGHEYLRRHGTLARLRGRSATELFRPWTVRNAAVARGLEGLVRHTRGPVTWTGAYTLSRVDVDPVGPGGDLPAEWDRRHQFTARVEGRALPGTSVYATWSFATGPPNPYARLPGETDRLGPYHRLDVGATTHLSTGPIRWTLRATAYNVYDRRNPWHRTPVGLLRRGGPDRPRRPELDVRLVDVYDLGARAAVSVSAAW